MIKNFIKITTRTLTRYKGYSLINIVGLGLGVAIFMISVLYARYQFSWDDYHPFAENMYRIHQKFNDGGTTARVSYPIKDQLLKDYPEIQHATNFAFVDEARIYINDKKYIANEFIAAESSFFDLFEVEFLTSNKEEAKKMFETSKSSLFISDAFGKILFGDENPLGKIIRFDAPDGQNAEFEVAGVYKALPKNTHFNYNVIFPLIQIEFFKQFVDNWNNPVVYTYVHIPDKAKAEVFQQQETLDGFIARHFPEVYGGPEAHLPVIAMKDIHLHSALYYEMGQNSSVILVWVVLSVGTLILILACINFMNLTTARATRRSKEVGLRKTLGASRGALMGQFLGESMVFSFISIAVGIIFSAAFLPYFNLYMSENLVIDWNDPSLYAFLGFLTVALGLFSGIYPAFILSSFNPSKALKESKGHSGSVGGFLVRKGLVVLQFIVISLLLVNIFTMKGQMNFILNKDLGNDSRNILEIRTSEKMFENPANYKAFIDQARRSPYVNNATGIANWAYRSFQYEGMDPNERQGANVITAGPDFAETNGLRLVSGRFLDPNRKSDRNSILLNETAVEQIGWDAASAVGKSIGFYEDSIQLTVAGVVKDYHTTNMFNKIEALGIMAARREIYPWSMFHVDLENKAAAVEDIKDAWMRFDDGWPADVESNSDRLMQGFTEVENLNQLMTQLTYLGILIACLGLYSLTAFSTERRIKEIGIRKVMGASVRKIWQLILSEFAIMVLISTVIGVGAGYMASLRILENFAYHIDISALILVGSAFLTITIAVITVSFEAIKSARINPVETLKME